MMRARGFGHLYHPNYRDKKTGEKKYSSTWWLKYGHRGKVVFVSCHSTDRRDAERFRLKILAEVLNERRGTLAELLAVVIRDYEVRQHRSLRSLRGSIENVRAFPRFARIEASALTSELWEDYIVWRRARGASNATINRERAAVMRGYRLGVERLDAKGRPMVPRIPRLTVLPEAPPRDRFIDQHEFEPVRTALLEGNPRSGPEVLADLAEFYWLTGWRRSEPTSLQWPAVNWFRRTITLEAAHSKNGSARDIGFEDDSALARLLHRRRTYTDNVEKQLGREVPWIFHRKGRPIAEMRKAWTAACDRAGIPAERRPHLHDFRRTQARDLLDAGVDTLLACRLVGWKSTRMLQRYRITEARDTARALAKVEAFRKQRPSRLGRGEVVPFEAGS